MSERERAVLSGYHGRKAACDLRQIATYCRPETVSFLDRVKDTANLRNRGEAIDELVGRLIRAEEGVCEQQT